MAMGAPRSPLTMLLFLSIGSGEASNNNDLHTAHVHAAKTHNKSQSTPEYSAVAGHTFRTQAVSRYRNHVIIVRCFLLGLVYVVSDCPIKGSECDDITIRRLNSQSDWFNATVWSPLNLVTMQQG